MAAQPNAVPNADADGLRRWRVAAGLMELDGHLLLVENLRRNGRTDWSTPGGVVEHGEDPVDGLTREVIEEKIGRAHV